VVRGLHCAHRIESLGMIAWMHEAQTVDDAPRGRDERQALLAGGKE
jgi:hypothetical protein